jgi:hypothetical protein
VKQSLGADTIVVKTTEYPISGGLDVYSSLHLNTTGANVEAAISMYGNQDPTSVLLNTLDGYDGVYSLIWSSLTIRRAIYASVDCSRHGLHAGNFVISSTTTNASSMTMVNSLPIGAAIYVDASTTGNSISADLPLTFEGLFNMTSPGAQIKYDPLAVDPTGARRKRITTKLGMAPDMHGTIRWAQFMGLPKPSVQGSVNLRTTEGAAILRL